MKTKLFILMLLPFFGYTAFSQDASKAKSEKSVTWFGVDYTLAKFTMVTEDPAVIVNQYLMAINRLILAEPEKFNIKTYFGKTEVVNDIDQVVERNAAIDPSSLVINDEHKITPEEVFALIKKYDTQGKSGMGLVFVAENLNKISQIGSYYVCFFDLSTKEIIDARRKTGKAAGFGFRNYWAGSAFNVMKTWTY
jgi:hypothetical protein